MKVDIENVEAILLEKKIEPIKVKEIIKDLTQAAEEEKEDRAANKIPTNKYEHIVILNDVEGKFKDEELTAWVVVKEEMIDSNLILSKLVDACKTQNEASKRKKNILTNFGEIFQSLKPKFLKEKGIRIKTKESVRVFTVNGTSL